MNCFEKLFYPADEPLEATFSKIIRIVKNISVFWRGCIEDLEGAEEISELRYGIIILFIESLMETDILIEGNYNLPVSEEHYFAMALENGLSNITKLSGDDLIEKFKLYEVNSDLSEIINFCNELINGLSENIPNPMISKGSIEYIKVLSNWVKAIKMTGLPSQLIEDLVLRK
jgi:hypothetical protein